jgi:hypothetical protein
MFPQHGSIGFLLILVAVQCLCCSCHLHPGTVTIEATITDPNGRQIPGAQMIVSDTAKDNDKAAKMSMPLFTYADQRGHFTIAHLLPARYRLIFVGSPFRSRAETYQLEAGQTLKPSVQLRADEEIFALDCPSRKIQATPPTDLNLIEIRLTRGACEGTCPAYTVTLSGDGKAEYDGERNVAVKGRQSYRVNKSGVLDLIRQFRDIGFSGFCASYNDTADDRQAIQTSLKTDGIPKMVTVYGNSAPQGLQKLDASIDEIAGVSRFVNSQPASSK